MKFNEKSNIFPFSGLPYSTLLSKWVEAVINLTIFFICKNGIAESFYA